MTGFIIGVFVGGFFRVGIMALMRLASEVDKEMNSGEDLSPEEGESND